MIFYFSATGNSKYAAERIARETGDEARSIEGQTPEDTSFSNGVLGIVTPTYCWELPGPMREFLKNLAAAGQVDYCFLVATYGSTPGCIGEEARRLLKRKGIKMNATFGIKMPDTWTPIFDLSDPAKVKETGERAEAEIAAVIRKINDRSVGAFMPGAMPYFLHPITRFFQKSVTKTRNFRVEDSCIGCGLCANRCPMSAIEMKESKPVWVKEHCAACLRCLHRCPKFSIQYGKNTAKHGQYTNPNTKV